MPDKDVKTLSLLQRFRLMEREAREADLKPWNFHENGKWYGEKYDKYGLTRPLQTFCVFAMIVIIAFGIWTLSGPL
ncbi:hypothetical protein [Aminobacter niigataensis]|uniref:hypothetical protein n=1 Tax=Aminobacter niigataensis TaxID=83265 RepID=UPI0024C775ED|nr:hypothetical protein [Aminobacter niigataensis]CAI2932960.1 protein of unknown function [Aminobacter niigataensis]